MNALEFIQGRATGRELHLEIICMDNTETSSALEEGYCIIGVAAAEQEGDTQ